MKRHERILDTLNKFDGARAARSIRASTVLQDLFHAIRKQRRGSDVQFNDVWSRAFVICSDAFKQRNGFYNHLVKALKHIRTLEDELNYYRKLHLKSEVRPYIDPEAKIDPSDHKTIITKV